WRGSGARSKHRPSPAQIVAGAGAKEILATAGATPSDLQSAIDRDLKSTSRALPDTRATIRFRNTSVSTGTSYNVVGLLPGSEPKLKSETILISGHHDHDGVSGSQICHVADDTSSR